MSLISNNIIPGSHGRIFGTNAKETSDLNTIKKSILTIEGIQEVTINEAIFPREITVYSSKLITVAEVEDKVKTTGFHAIPKENLEL
ncbi:heavy-metal-associated domain-containing protein [Flavobacterium algicola]|uniref:heavy-metal-associated domain-containing protein n=1 Tax=Flavobacterium algicola TaxID=556529 RepID=UPI001EFE3282|nr:heavy metal-associated domain-containing protein [Flavobacterium algicola]MCG9792228.1 heavy-metal-associated domain-containing protein [Flavobacterium algicola]